MYGARTTEEMKKKKHHIHSEINNWIKFAYIFLILARRRKKRKCLNGYTYKHIDFCVAPKCKMQTCLESHFVDFSFTWIFCWMHMSIFVSKYKSNYITCSTCFESILSIQFSRFWYKFFYLECSWIIWKKRHYDSWDCFRFVLCRRRESLLNNSSHNNNNKCSR